MIQLWGDSRVRSKNDTILKAIKGESTSHTPVWFMRQAGRSQPEYRKLKEKYSLFEIT
ncbi:uroporphyrinogen decarboxylase family protein, partial [Staphylococcus epidermidis]